MGRAESKLAQVSDVFKYVLPLSLILEYFFMNIDDLNFERTVVTVGSFDGVHCGHRALLRRVVDIAARHSLRSVILTFCPHPRQALDPKGETPLLLNTPDERIALLKQTGIDDVIVVPFDNVLSQMSASDFIREIIIGKYNAKYLVVGQDHHFGKGRSGNVQHLREFVSQSDLQAEVVDLKSSDRKISSSAIRKALLNGDLMQANEMLGYEYIISGKIITGNQLGRTIGFPTANIEIAEYKLLPKEGVYRVRIKNSDHVGMMHIGKRTILKKEDTAVHVEVNIFDFDQQIYGKEITLALTHRIRDHIRFDNIEQLTGQLHRDKQKVLSINLKI